ncbi:MAG: hypothetical protein AAFQ68_29085, partial [Bacteroidota bacterium]
VPNYSSPRSNRRLKLTFLLFNLCLLAFGSSLSATSDHAETSAISQSRTPSRPFPPSQQHGFFTPLAYVGE